MTLPLALNFVDGRSQRPDAPETLPVRNPASAEAIAAVPLSTAADVDLAVSAALAALDGWRRKRRSSPCDSADRRRTMAPRLAAEVLR